MHSNPFHQTWNKITNWYLVIAQIALWPNSVWGPYQLHFNIWVCSLQLSSQDWSLSRTQEAGGHVRVQLQHGGPDASFSHRGTTPSLSFRWLPILTSNLISNALHVQDFLCGLVGSSVITEMVFRKLISLNNCSHVTINLMQSFSQNLCMSWEEGLRDQMFP